MTQYRLSERQNTKVGGWPVSTRTASTLHTPGPTTSRFQHWSLKKRVHWKATSSVMSRDVTRSLSPRREMSAMCASCSPIPHSLVSSGKMASAVSTVPPSVIPYSVLLGVRAGCSAPLIARWIWTGSIDPFLWKCRWTVEPSTRVTSNTCFCPESTQR